MLHRKTQQMADWPRDIPVISSFTMGFLWVSYGFPMVGTTKVIDRPGLCARCATGPRSLHSGPALGLQQRGGIRNVDPQRPLDDLVVPLGNLHMSLYDSILVGCRWSIMRCMYIYISIYLLYTDVLDSWQWLTAIFCKVSQTPMDELWNCYFFVQPRVKFAKGWWLRDILFDGLSKRSPDIFWEDAKWLVRRAETAKQKGSEMIGAQHWDLTLQSWR